MKIRKELWFGFILMALIIAGTAVMLLILWGASLIQASTLAPASSPVRVMSLRAARSLALMRLSVATAGMLGAAGARVSKSQEPVGADQPEALPATSTTRA